MTTEIPTPTPKKKKGLYLLVAGVILLLAIGACGFFAYNRFINTATDVVDQLTNNEQLAEVLATEAGAVNTAANAVMPLYPNAVPVPQPEGTPATDTRTFFQAQATPDEVEAWYRNALEAQGSILVNAYQDGDTRILRFEKDLTALDIFIWSDAEGQTGFSLRATALQLPQEAPPSQTDPSAVMQPPAQLEVTAPSAVMQPPAQPEVTAPSAASQPPAQLEVTAPSAVMQPPAPPSQTAPSAASQPPVSLDITANVPSLKAGTLTRYTYDLSLSSTYTAPITSSVEAILPAGITLLPDDSPGIRYFPADRKVTYRATLTPQQPTHLIKLVVVTDQFIRAGELRLKAYLSVGDDAPILAVNQLLATN